MFDELMTPITYLVGIVVLFLAVVGIYSAKMDSNAQTYCNDVIEEFVDRSRASGYISAESYLEMMRKINSTGNLYEVEITHQSKTSVPYIDASGNEVQGRYAESYNAYYRNEILGVLFPDGNAGYGNYPLKKGDYLKVNFSLKEPTLGGRMLWFVTRKDIKTISGSYGGYVGSTEENGLM